MSGQVSATLGHLATHGWITLRSMSALLGYAHPTGIYGRQKGKNPIPAIKIGGTYRVYAACVVEALENVPEEDQEAARILISVYRKLKKQGEPSE